MPTVQERSMRDGNGTANRGDSEPGATVEKRTRDGRKEQKGARVDDQLDGGVQMGKV